MELRDRLLVAFALLGLALLGGSLVAAPPADPEPTPSPPGAGAERVLREGVVGVVATLDPLYTTTQAERDLASLIFSGLTRLGPGNSLAPDLAEAWSAAADGKSYTFRLRRDLRWHDGLPVTSDDVVFTVRSLQHPDYDGHLQGAWRGIDVRRIDGRTVRFHLKTATPGFLQLTTMPILPAHLFADTPVADRAASPFGLDPIGSGPFQLESLGGEGARLVRAQAGQAALLEPVASPSVAAPAEPTPSRAGRPAAALDAVEFHFYDDEAALAEAFDRGEVDAAAGLSAELAEATATAASVGGSHVVTYPRTVLTAVVLNLRPDRAAFRDARVRRALLMSIDRQAIVAAVLGGAGRLSDTPIPPASDIYDPASGTAVPFDRKEAARLFAAAGWKRGDDGWVRPGVKGVVAFEVSTVEAAANPIAAAVAERVVADWRAAGLAPVLVPYSGTELAERKLGSRQYEAAVVDMNLGHDPDLFPLFASSQAVAGGSNVAGYQSARLDALLNASRAFVDAATRNTRYKSLQQTLAAQLPLLPICFADYGYLVRDSLEGPDPRLISSPEERFWDVLTWRLADGPDR